MPFILLWSSETSFMDSIASLLSQHRLLRAGVHYTVACDISEWHILHFSSWSILVLHLRGTILFNWLEWLVLCLCRLIVIYRMDLKSISIILGKNTHKTQLMACTTICDLSLIITKKERDWIKNVKRLSILWQKLQSPRNLTNVKSVWNLPDTAKKKKKRCGIHSYRVFKPLSFVNYFLFSPLDQLFTIYKNY